MFALHLDPTNHNVSIALEVIDAKMLPVLAISSHTHQVVQRILDAQSGGHSLELAASSLLQVLLMRNLKFTQVMTHFPMWH